jgi:inorganic pyrophosphatase
VLVRLTDWLLAVLIFGHENTNFLPVFMTQPISAARISTDDLMSNLFKLPTFSDDGNLRVVVETPRGSQAKLDYDPKLKTFALSKSLLTGLSYPYDWGFIPATRAEDGDPLDVMVIHDAATYPGLVLTCKIIGVLQVEQHRKRKKAKRNDRVFVVPRGSHAEKDLSDVRDLTSAKREELEKFFIATDELEDKQLKILGWKGPKAALKTIKKGADAFQNK